MIWQFQNWNLLIKLEQAQVNKDVALLFKARVALYAGTWEKYHQGTVFAGSTDGSGYLQQAAEAAQSVMSNGNYSIAMGDSG